MRTRTMRKKLEERSATAAAPAAAASAGGRSAPPPAASQAFRLHIPSRRHSPHGGGALQLPPLSLRSKKAKATPRENQPGAHLKTPRVRVPNADDAELLMPIPLGVRNELALSVMLALVMCSDVGVGYICKLFSLDASRICAPW